MAFNQNENELHVYSINESEHIGAIYSTVGGTNTYRAVVVVDTSMPVAKRIVNEILPLVMSKLKNWNELVRLFTFGKQTTQGTYTSLRLQKTQIECNGPPSMAPVIKCVIHELQWPIHTWVRSFDVLVISAGEICDHFETQEQTKKLVKLAEKRGWRINSQAIRLITTSNQPDTKALAYILQINNSTAAKICDVDMMSTSTNETIADTIAALFPENTFPYAVLDVNRPISLRHPWTSFQSNIYIVMKGWNIFWLSQMPDVVKIQDEHVTVVSEGQLTLENFQQLMKKKLPQIITQMTILKIVGTTEAKKSVDEMFLYFTETERKLSLKCGTPNTKAVTNALANIAKFKPDFRDSGELIRFHRNPIATIEDRKGKKREEDERVRMVQVRRNELERINQEEVEHQKEQDKERQKCDKPQSSSSKLIVVST